MTGRHQILERDNSLTKSELKESNPPVEESVCKVVLNATDNEPELVQNNVQPESKVEECSM